MNRLFSGILASAMALTFVFASPAVYAHGAAKTHTTMHSSKWQSKKMMKHTCPAGKHWVKAYKRNGKLVHGYCR